MDLPPGLVAFWDFKERAAPYVSDSGINLHVERGVPKPITSGPFGGGVYLPAGTNLYSRNSALNMAGAQAVTVIAYVKRLKPRGQPLCIAGIWDETTKSRQYALFHHLPLVGGYRRPYFHVSRNGGPTPGYQYCIDGAATRRQTGLDTMQMLGGTYANDSDDEAWAYLDGVRDSYTKVDIALDRLDGGEAPIVSRNPYVYKPGLNFTPTAPFRVNAADGKGLNSRNMELGALAVWNRALSAAEVAQVHAQVEVA